MGPRPSSRGPLAGVLAVCTALFCCGGTVTFVWRQYDGPSRSKHSIAIIRQNGTSSTLIVALDGKAILAPIEADNRLHVEVLPGIHDVDVAAPGIGLRHVVPVRLLAEAGKVYRVEVTASAAAPPQPVNGEPPLEEERWVARAYEVDRDTDAPRGNAEVPVARAALARGERTRSPEDAGSSLEGGGDGAPDAFDEGGLVER
jgi:hypothetical protein